MHSKLTTIVLVFAFALFLVACDDDNTSNNNTNNVNNTNNPEICDNAIDDDGDGTTDCADTDCATALECNLEICDNGIDDNGDGAVDCDDEDCTEFADCTAFPREAFELTISLHDPGTQKMNLRDRTAGGTLESCDFGFIDDELNGPKIMLCPDTTAYNGGNGTAFLDVTAAPTDVTYEADGVDTYVIGNSWLDGGTCADGWTCNGNIYFLHLSDGSYAKLEVVFGQGGTMTVLAFRDVDGGSDLTCDPLPQ
ncbi:MAG: hypothetical protein CVU59_12090 [Deltaproteobacteria bacterium HGW-Deltaproteobacteria-17]|nr:MAG: hypothetical protein CVU59_12090 [Deltaproteobacteria bacterium HGW-Deltaproteobacteria-17]